MSFADKVKKLVEEAPVAVAGGRRVNFGPTKFFPTIVRFKGKGQKPDKWTFEQYIQEHGLDSVDDIELGDREQYALNVDVDITKLNPSLDFHYEREVLIVNSRRDPKNPSKNILTDWSETFLPALEKVFGKNWEEKIFPNGKGKEPTLYLAVEQVDPVNPPKEEGKKVYSVPKVIGWYKSMDELRAAQDEMYPPRDEEAEMEFGPDSEVEEEDGEGEIPESALKEVKALYKSTRNNFKQTRKMLEGNPFGKYDPDELLEAAGISR